MNEYRLLGAAAIFLSSSWVGLHAALRVRQLSAQLRQLILSVELMQCEISYGKTPLDRLCAVLAASCTGAVAELYRRLDAALQAHAFDMTSAASEALRTTPQLRLSSSAEQILMELLSSFGQYGTTQQLQLIEHTLHRLRKESEALEAQKKNRCRCYEMLGVCTGLALMILVV